MSVTQAPKLPLSIHVCHQITFDDINISGQALMNSGVDSLGMERLHSGGGFTNDSLDSMRRLELLSKWWFYYICHCLQVTKDKGMSIVYLWNNGRSY